METQDWMLEQIHDLEARSRDYRQKALFQEFAKVIEEQYKRIKQAEGEVDGRMWSPKEWS